MSKKPGRQRLFYGVFLVTASLATVLGLLFIWGIVPEQGSSMFLLRLLGTSVVLAMASAMAMSATRLVAGPPPEDERA